MQSAKEPPKYISRHKNNVTNHLKWSLYQNPPSDVLPLCISDATTMGVNPSWWIIIASGKIGVRFNLGFYIWNLICAKGVRAWMKP